MRCVGQPHKRLAGLIVARTSKSRRKGSSNWKVREVGVCPRIDGTDGTHETDRANGTDRPEGPWEPSLGFRFSPYAGLKDRKTSSGASRLLPRPDLSPSQNPAHYGENNADENAGSERKIESEIALLDRNIAWQVSEPAKPSWKFPKQ